MFGYRFFSITMALAFLFFVECSPFGKFWEDERKNIGNQARIATHLYTVESGTVKAYAIDQKSGSLSFAAGPFSAGTPNTVVIDPRTHYAYVLGASPNGLRVYSVEDPSTFVNLGNYLPSNAATKIAIPQSGNFVYPSDDMNIFGFSADTSGNLASLSGFPLAAGCMAGSAVFADPLSRWLYHFSTGTNLKTDQINSDGTVTLSTQSAAVASTAVAGRFLGSGEGFYYIHSSTSATDNIHYYPVDQSTGALAAGAGFPLSAGCVSASDAMLHPNEKFLYAADYADKAIYTYSVDPTTRSLTQLGAPVATPNAPSKMAVTPDGKYLYLGGDDAGGVGLIRTYAIGNDGSLASMPDLTLSNPSVTSITVRTVSAPPN